MNTKKQLKVFGIFLANYALLALITYLFIPFEQLTAGTMPVLPTTIPLWQRFQVQLLRVARVGFEDHLVLVELLQAVGVLTVVPIVRADGRLDVGHIPGLGAEHTQVSGRVHRPGTDLGVVRLPDQATVAGPEILQLENDGLKGEAWFH